MPRRVRFTVLLYIHAIDWLIYEIQLYELHDFQELFLHLLTVQPNLHCF